jgi:hypothetical protein
MFCHPALFKAGGPVSGGPVDITHIGTDYVASPGKTNTFVAVPIGDPAADRVIIVCLTGNDTANNGAIVFIDNATIGGEPTLLIGSQRESGNNLNTPIVTMVAIKYPTGTTADMYFEYNRNSERMAISIYRMTGTVDATPYDAYQDSNDNSVNEILYVDVEDNGAIVCVGCSVPSGSMLTCSPIPEDVQQAWGTRRWVTGHDEYEIGESEVITINRGGGKNTPGVAGSWSPA